MGRACRATEMQLLKLSLLGNWDGELWEGMHWWIQCLRHLRALEELIILRSVESKNHC